MPTYDYECDACGHTFDAFQNMSDAPLKKCPDCGKLKLRRLIGGGLGVIFKGSGFYATDSKGGGKSKAKVSTAEGGSETTSSSDTPKTEKKGTDASSGSTGDSSSSSKPAASTTKTG